MPPKKGAKPAKTAPKTRTSAIAPGSTQPASNTISGPATKLQQQILDIFRSAFSDLFDQDLPAKIQTVKAALYERDFASAFGSRTNLEAYAARWSPSRALAYATILKDVYGGMAEMLSEGHGLCSEHGMSLRMLCLGGGAGAELVAAAALSRALNGHISSRQEELYDISMAAVDLGDWAAVLNTLHAAIITAPTLSRFAAAHIVAANRAFAPAEQFRYGFHQQDVLEAKFGGDLRSLVLDVDLVTCFFTMNELFSTSIPQTQHLLLQLKRSMRGGTFFLVVDSAGSYATVSLNGNDKTYPMQWLLDHTMLQQPASHGDSDDIEQRSKWTKIRSEDSAWFRLPEGLRYPLELENMRYQLHLYHKSEIS